MSPLTDDSELAVRSTRVRDHVIVVTVFYYHSKSPSVGIRLTLWPITGFCVQKEVGSRRVGQGGRGRRTEGVLGDGDDETCPFFQWKRQGGGNGSTCTQRN